MLLRYGTKNFFSFKDWMEIDFTFNLKVSKEIQSNDNVARAICLKGANASGKTNALKAIAFLAHFCKNSFNFKPDEALHIDTFFNNEEPAEFFIDFKADGIEYSYETSLTDTHVISEKIYRKEMRKTLVLSRAKDKLEKNSFFDTNREFALRSNASIISTAKQYEIPEFNVVYKFFDGIFANVGYKGLQHDLLDYTTLSSLYNTQPEILEFVKSKIMKFDTGVQDIKIESVVNEKNKKRFYPVFKHIVDEGTGDLLFHSQSSGTKSLYLYLVFYYLTLKRGGVLVLDEFDINLHPDILPHLIALFDDPLENTKNSQLIFSTHNTEVIDLMRKYRTYLFNKENGASYCYRLDELSNNVIRNDRPISPLYKSGKIGGVPKI